MRNVDVYGNGVVLIDGQPFDKVIDVKPPIHGEKASVILAVDGKIIFHNGPRPAVPTQAAPYDWAEAYRTLVERLTNAMQAGKLDQQTYGKLLATLPSI